MSRARVGAIAALLLALNVAPASAQFGGLGRRIRERVQKAVDDRGGSADSSARAAAGLNAPRFNNNVLELTPDVLDRALKGDDAERAHAAQRAAIFARIDAASHPAARPSSKASRAKDPGDAFSECILKYMGSDDATIRRKCGDVQDMLAKQEAAERARRAAEQAHADSLHRDSTVDIPADSVGAMAGGFTRRQYGIVKERISAWLASEASAARASRSAGVPGCADETRSDYAFSDAERSALADRREQLAARFTIPHHMRAVRKGCPA